MTFLSLTGDGSQTAALRGAALSADGHSAYVFNSQEKFGFYFKTCFQMPTKHPCFFASDAHKASAIKQSRFLAAL